MRTAWNKDVAIAAMPFLLGMAAFFLIVGPRVLRPTNIAWLSSGYPSPHYFGWRSSRNPDFMAWVSSEDPAQHYLGWHFFRNSDWSFPIGLNPDYGLELSNAILFSDSIPLLAFLFKPFSSLLPETFQYFGLWLLACFVLQAWLAWKLVGLVSRHPAVRFLGAGLFVFAPPMIWRLQVHSSLAGHFLILAALYLSLRSSRRLRTPAWVLVLVVAALVHPYLLAMVAVLWLADSTRVWVRQERPARLAVMELAGISAIIGLACWQSGYFTAGSGVSVSGYGQYRMNLLSILDANGWSYVLKDLPRTKYEGFHYLGLGVIILALCALPVLINGRVGLAAAIKQRVILVGALTGLSLFALSHKLGIGSLEIGLPLPGPLLRTANLLRTSDRMFWPVFYGLVLTIIFITVRGNRPRTAISLLAVALTVQVIDTRAGWQGIRNQLMAEPATEWYTPLKDPFWTQAAARYRKVRWIPPKMSYSPHWRTLSVYAGRHGLGTDAVYLARFNPSAYERARKNASVTLNTGRYQADSLYVLDPTQRQSAVLHLDPETDLLARIDGLYLVAPGWKRCRACGHLDKELKLADVLPAIGIGERIRFSKSGGGVAYLATGWFEPETWGTWSMGPAAKVVLRTSSDGIHSILIEANALVSPAHPKQDIEISVNGIPAATLRLTAYAANRIRVPIPAAARDELRKSGALRLKFRFPDTVRPRDIGLNDDPRALALGLLAITLI
ncbi:DUF6311 domain-containing protein [Candidatus Thiosymbion oneisti]|uniref:DUF6311 domain-containing protein n=1 Tax=Candidatus Thiosymbion oneisti TaxID=589554 RepID=UPI000A7318A5|nr:DUF6311 domain-containing protein [Candidatus Thiosymbion oneisti]